jgi:hypothetical protein
VMYIGLVPLVALVCQYKNFVLVLLCRTPIVACFVFCFFYLFFYISCFFWFFWSNTFFSYPEVLYSTSVTKLVVFVQNIVNRDLIYCRQSAHSAKLQLYCSYNHG